MLLSIPGTSWLAEDVCNKNIDCKNKIRGQYTIISLLWRNVSKNLNISFT